MLIAAQGQQGNHRFLLVDTVFLGQILAGIGIHQNERPHFLPCLLKPYCHGMGDIPPQRPSQEMVRALGLHGFELCNIIRRHDLQ
ncbi:hypothetical protein D3C75_938700 [compost metagenome]